MIGDLNHRITIEQKNRVSDGAGGFTESWSTFKTVWGRVQEISARERMFANRLEGNISHRVTVRYLDGVTSEMRIGWRGRLLKIVGPPVNEDERRKYLTISCEEGAGS